MSDQTLATNAPIVPQSAPSVPHSAPANLPPNAPGRPAVPQDAPEIVKRKNKANLPFRPLSPRQLMAVRLILGGHRLGAIAQAIKVDRKTLYRWTCSRAFMAEVWRLHEELCRDGLRQRGRR